MEPFFTEKPVDSPGSARERSEQVASNGTPSQESEEPRPKRKYTRRASIQEVPAEPVKTVNPADAEMVGKVLRIILDTSGKSCAASVNKRADAIHLQPVEKARLVDGVQLSPELLEGYEKAATGIAMKHEILAKYAPEAFLVGGILLYAKNIMTIMGELEKMETDYKKAHGSELVTPGKSGLG